MVGILSNIGDMAAIGLLSTPETFDPLQWFQSSRQGSKTCVVSGAISRAESRLLQIAALPEDWDGYGGEPISESAIRNTKAILPFLAEELDILESAEFIPNPYGTVSILWEKHGETAHLEIGASRFSFYGPESGSENLLKLEGTVNRMSRNILDSLATLYDIKREGESSSLTLAA